MIILCPEGETFIKLYSCEKVLASLYLGTISVYDPYVPCGNMCIMYHIVGIVPPRPATLAVYC